MSREFLYRASRSPAHRKMRTKRVAKRMSALSCELRLASCPTNVVGHHLLRQRPSVILTENPRRFRMACGPKCSPQHLRHRHIPQTSTLRGCHVPFPLGSLNAKLSLREIDVFPMQRSNLHVLDLPLPPGARSTRHASRVLSLLARGGRSRRSHETTQTCSPSAAMATVGRRDAGR